MARTNYTSLGINTIGDNDSDIEFIIKRYTPITTLDRDAILNPVNGMKIYNSDTNTINRFAAGSWAVGETIVIAHEDQWIQTRTQGTFTHTYEVGDGTIITPMTITITPQKAGNKAVIEFVIFGEAALSGRAGFVITRNGVLLPDSSDGSNNGYAVNGVQSFDNNNTSTPQVNIVRIIDENTLGIASTYNVLFRATNSSTETYYFNRSVNAPASSAETGVSTAKIIEFVV